MLLHDMSLQLYTAMWKVYNKTSLLQSFDNAFFISYLFHLSPMKWCFIKALCMYVCISEGRKLGSAVFKWGGSCQVFTCGKFLSFRFAWQMILDQLECQFHSCTHASNLSFGGPPNSTTCKGPDNRRGEGAMFDVLLLQKPSVKQIESSLLWKREHFLAKQLFKTAQHV